MSRKTISEGNATPFLRWAGGKTWFIKELDTILNGLNFTNYHEPFLGGGAIFFAINPPKKVFLNDSNYDLIQTYECIRDNVEGVISELRKFENTEECYYLVRNTKYKSSLKRAARFIFLNQTSFNGIYRVNLKGEYNVPFGFRKKEFLDPDNLMLVSERLKAAILGSGDFELCIKNIKKDDLVFLDPPYTITHNNNGFFKYNQKLFSENDQYRLSRMIDKIKEKKAFYILTNAAHEKVKEIFDKGDTILDFKRASLIGGINSKRGKYEEMVITNIPKHI